LIPAHNLHATLAFLGEVDAPGYHALLDMASSLRQRRFELVFDRLDYWRHNAIVCATAGVIPARLSALVGALREQLQARGFRTEDRTFSAHVTLLRCATLTGALRPVSPLTWAVGALSLIETTRDEGKLRYRERQCWTLED
jgi:2'-5' RNA ligase